MHTFKTTIFGELTPLLGSLQWGKKAPLIIYLGPSGSKAANSRDSYLEPLIEKVNKPTLVKQKSTLIYSFTTISGLKEHFEKL